MPEIRTDPLTRQTVLIAPERALRPIELLAERARAVGECPFCEGREGETPGEVFAFRAADSAANAPGWRVRVVPNKYPAVDPLDAGHNGGGRARGVHEVVIESSRHVRSLTQLSTAELCEVVLAYRERLKALRADGRLRYALAFKNVGAAAGASLEHAHGQLMGLEFVPDEIERRLAATRAWFETDKECYVCQLLTQERAAGERIVRQSDRFLAFCPFASRFPYETWVAPTSHFAHFDLLPDEDVAPLAAELHAVLGRLEAVIPEFAYNVLVHTSPFDTTSRDYYHWRIEIASRVTKLAGFELATGAAINPVPPELAAARLRIPGVL